MERDDGAFADKQQAGPVVGNRMLHLAASGELLACPVVDPVAFRQVDRVTEYTDKEVLAEHILIDHIVRLAVVGKHQRHGADDRHTGLRAFQGCRIDIGHEGIAQLHIVAVHLLFLFREVEGLVQRVPAVDLHPGQEEAEMQALQFFVLIHIHHVAGCVHETAHPEVQLVEEGGAPASVIAAGRGAPMLGSGPAGGVMMPGTAAGVLAGHLVHLFREKDLVQVVHFLIRTSVIVLEVRVFVDRAGGVQLEAVYAVVHEMGQVVHPVFQPGSVFPGSGGQRVLFGDAQVIFFAQPKPQVIAHPMQAADEEAVVLLLRIAGRIPIGFCREQLIVPFLLSREVIAFLHPLGFEPEEVAGYAHIAEPDGIVQDIELVFEHVRSKA